jgi:hypothetical protein
MSQAKEPSGNADYVWDQFDSEAYFQHYYGDPHPDDDLVIQLAVKAFKKAAAAGDKPYDLVDVGTGPNLIPFFSALPVSAKLTAWEYAQSNVNWLKKELASDEMRPQWRHFWPVARQAYAPEFETPENPLPVLRQMTTVTQGSIFDLPKRQWTAGTMFFCAESITSRFDEFEQGVAAYCQSVKQGGLLAAAFLVRSGGYVVADKPFPVLHVLPDQIQETFAKHATDVHADLIGIVEREIRSGYSGFIFLTGRAKG